LPNIFPAIFGPLASRDGWPITHIGYVSRGLYQRFYQDTVDNISQWLDHQRPAPRQPVSGKQHNG
jgi:hypothetical protein